MRKESAYFQQFTTQQLETMLRLELDQPQQEDEAVLLQILEVLKEREKDKGTLPDVQKAWERFQSQYNIPEMEGLELYDLEEAPTQEKEAKNEENVVPIRSPRRVRKPFRAAIVVAAIAFVMLGTGICAHAAGYDIYGLLATWTNTVFRFQAPADSPASGAEPSNEDIQNTEQNEASKEFQAAINAIGIHQNLAPTWWPEEFDNYRVNHEIFEDSFAIASCELTNEEENRGVLITVCEYYDKELLARESYEKDDAPMEIYGKNGRKYYIMSNVDTTTATWTDGTFNIVITGQVSKEEIKTMIDSIGG